MRKNILFVGLFFISLVAFVSCNDDDDLSLNHFVLTRATVDSINANTFSLILDNGEKLWVAASYVSYRPKDEQRVFISYTILSNEQSGEYAHYVRLNDLAEILTKKIVDLTPDNEEAIGNDPIKLFNLNTNGGFLNVDFGFNVGGSQRHFINLVRNTMAGNPDDGKVYLEFRHNAFNDPSLVGTNAYVAFNLKELQTPETDSVKIVIKFNEFTGETNREVVYKFNNQSVESEIVREIKSYGDKYH